MDQKWRMRIGIPGFRSRRSEKDSFRQSPCSGTGTFDADDFSDVFGGPPRTIISRQFSDRFSGRESSSFYEEIFRSSEFISRSQKGGRSLPAFRIPVKEDMFYCDVFGSDDGRRSRVRSVPSSKAKTRSNSSSVLSSEELSPLRPVIVDDAAFFSSASEHRPINVPTQWNSYKTLFEEQEMPQFPSNISAYTDSRYPEDDYKDSFRNSFLRQPVSSPETVSFEPDSFRSVKISVDDLELNSPSSADSSLCEDPVYYGVIHDTVLPEEDDDDDDAMSSYVIEINSLNREESREEVSIDEAIAWAKSKYQSPATEIDLSVRQQESEQSGEEEGRPVAYEFSDQQFNGNGMSEVAEAQQRDLQVEEGKPKDDSNRELEGLDEKIKLWSAGKETNIRLLLSTLHYILWSNSGWFPMSLTNLIGGSQVKKAYQKARLCLHPDKLQQRGATTPQKYVAEKAFSFLQDAWAMYISQDVFLS